MAFGFRLFRGWGISVDRAALGLTINGLATQASKLILPALAVLLLTITGTLPGLGLPVAVAIALPVALGVLVGIWIMRSEAFARRVGAFATRATDAVARRIHRPEPVDLTDRLMGFREAARDMLLDRLVPTGLSQLLARSMGYVLLLVSLRAVGVPGRRAPAGHRARGLRRRDGDHAAPDRARRRGPAGAAVHQLLLAATWATRPGTTRSRPA